MKDKSMRMCGVYTIINLKNRKRYIGGSSNVEHRMHIQKLAIKNGDCSPLMRADLKEYGSKYFRVFLLEFCTRDELCEKENYYMAKYNTRDRNYGYNRLPAHECDYSTPKVKIQYIREDK